ncbi:PREDICTED: MLP-like protein 328 [Tarenaya hassleriana]|uniref:MLP-like protein 328 n=1 Tax=Tarenaya hassleriana TaxID=28532 RepID=UPI00053C69A5|nr:PREDICTED: MLP-like protein 328 [Tarenaya hassleriana]
MASSGTYVGEVSLKGSAGQHYGRWRNENNLFPDAIGHHIQAVNLHHGEWHSHGSIRTWHYTCEGKQEVLKEKREIDDEKQTLTAIGLEGNAMEELKVITFILQFGPNPNPNPNPSQGCVCKITVAWEKRNENAPEPIRYFKLVKQMVAEMDDHVLIP